MPAADSQAAPAFDGKSGGQVEGPWGSLKGQLQLESAEERQARRWQAEQALQVPVAGPLFVYGKVSANYNTWTAQQMTMSGRTGVGCKLKPVAGSEITLTGSSVRNRAEDPLQPNHLAHDTANLIVELQANYAVLGALKLEYQGAATAPLDPLAHNSVQQDLHFALPLGKAGDFRLGAKHQWQDVPGPGRPWTDGMQLYLGLGLKR